MKPFKEKSFAEQVEEASQHSHFGAILKKHYLAATGYDHIIVGGTPPYNRMLDHPEKPLVELLTDPELEGLLDIKKAASLLKITPEEFEQELSDRLATGESYPLVSEILFLAEAGRLPEKFRKYLPDKAQ
jgi:hypothetical protein